MTQNEQKLYDKSKSLLGTKLVSSQDAELGCALTVNRIHRLAFGDDIGGGASTWLLWQALKDRNDFEECENEQGAIIISPSGTSTISGKYNGHVGIMGKNPSADGSVYIMSNNSLTGKLDTKFTLDSWNRYYGMVRGFPIYFYRKLDNVEVEKKTLIKGILSQLIILYNQVIRKLLLKN